MRSKLLILLFVLFGFAVQAQAQCIASGGQISCVIPGATVTGSGTSQVVALSGGITATGGSILNGIAANSTGNNCGTPAFSWSASPNAGMFLRATNEVGICANSSNQLAILPGIISTTAGNTIGWVASTTDADNTRDLTFARGASNILWLGNAAGSYDNTASVGDQSHRLIGVNAVGVFANSIAASSGIVTESLAPITSCTGSGCAPQTGALNSVGTLTTTTTGAATITLNFSITATNGSACIVQNETTANIMKPTSTTTQLVITGVTAAGDKISYQCKFF